MDVLHKHACSFIGKVGQGSRRDSLMTRLAKTRWSLWGIGETLVTNECHLFGWKLPEFCKNKC